MNFNHLQFVLEVAGSGSFTKASEACCVTQPTLSNGIKQLEGQLGGELFVRTTRQVSLTPFGEHLLPFIRTITDAQQELTDSATSYFAPDHQLLSLGFSPLVDMRIIDVMMAPFTHANPQVHTYFKECFIEDIVDRLDEGQMSLAIRPIIGLSSSHGKEGGSISVYREPVFAIPRDDPSCEILGEGALTIQQAANEVFSLTPNICGHANATREWFARQGKTIKEYPGQAVSYQIMQDWANLGLASAILPWSKISSENRPKSRQLFSQVQQPIYLEFELVWDKKQEQLQPLASFLSYCEEKLANIIDGLYLEGELFRAAHH